MTLSATLDKLSREHVNVSPLRQFFNEEFLENWSSKSRELCDEFRALESNEERQKWLKSVLIEIFVLFQEPQLPGKLTMPQISRLIEDISSSTVKGISNQELSSIVGKMFISVSNQFVDGDDTKLIALVRITSSLSREFFKFSRFSSKLMNSEQTVLQRHLLKRSKYELRKFNLLAECPTGYSQLVMLLFTAYYDPDNRQKISYYIRQLYHIVGKYSLDTMRCLGVILDVSSDFITDHHLFLVEFLKHSDYWPRSRPADNLSAEELKFEGNIMASNVISFHLNQESADLETNYVDMVCVLIKSGFVNALSIWENIGPDNNTMNKFFEDFDRGLEEESMRGVMNPLAMAAALTSGDEEGSDIKTQQRQRESDESKSERKGETVLGDQEESAADDRANDTFLQKGKLFFLQRLLVHGCIRAAFYILNLYPKFVFVDDTIPVLIGRAFEHVISPIYGSLVFSPQPGLKSGKLVARLENGMLSHKTRLIEERKTHDPFLPFELRTRGVFYYDDWIRELSPADSIDDLFKQSHEFFSILGTRLALSPKLISKLCRIGRADITNGEASVDRWIDYVRKFIFPAIVSLDLNPIVTNDFYDLLKLFPFEKRYFMYNEMISTLSQDVLPIKVAFKKTEREARSILKALSIDTIDVQSRRLANLASTNPLATLLPTVKQIENYDKVSELVIITTTFFNEFAYDVLQYVLLLRLTDNRAAVQKDGVNQSMWVQRLSIFIAGLAKSCDKMDMSNIKEYIIKTLHNGNIIAVTILRELIATVGGIRDLNEVNMKQLRMLNSGEPLIKVARRLMFDFRDDNRELASKFMRFFADQGAVSEVILLLYNLNLRANTQIAHYKILSTRCDEMNTLLWSYIELVKHCFDPAAFVANVLPLDILANEYHVSTPWVFHIWRNYIDAQEDDRGVDSMIQKAKFEEVNFSQIPRDLFTCFWKLSLYDVQFDKGLYDERKVILEEQQLTLSSTRKKSEISNNVKDLLLSCISHQKKFNKVCLYLQEQSQTWTRDLTEETIKAFFQYCVVPRIIFSPPDAMYTSSFLLLTFDMKTFMRLFGNFMRSGVLSSLLFCCTSSEAGNLGIFFAELLGRLEDLRRDKQLDEPSRRELYSWHTIITEQTVVTLCNKNYMSIRNGIEFMKHVSNVFPVVDAHIRLVCQTISENLEEEEREDIKLPSNALLGHLTARLKKALKLDEFCELNAEELKKRAELESELEEIRLYELQLANEKKEAELRKRLEFNKKQRENADRMKEKLSSQSPVEDSKENKPIAQNPSSAKREVGASQVPSWPFGKVLRFMDEVCYNFQNNNLNRALDCILDQTEKNKIRDLMKLAMPLKDFRSSLLEIVENFFVSLVHYPNNSEFVQKMEDLRAAVENVTRDAAKKRSDMYTDSSVIAEPSKKNSRYSGGVKNGVSVGSNTTDSSTTVAEVVSSPTNAPAVPINAQTGKEMTRKEKNDSNRDESSPRSGDLSLGRESSRAEGESNSLYSSRRSRKAFSDRTPEYDLKNKGPRSTAASDARRKASTPLAPRALLYSDRPSRRSEGRTPRAPSSQSRTQGTNDHKSYDPQSNGERPQKRFRSDENRNSYRTSESRSRDNRKDLERSRYGDRKGQNLPQGPKGNKDPTSRYQR